MLLVVLVKSKIRTTLNHPLKVIGSSKVVFIYFAIWRGSNVDLNVKSKPIRRFPQVRGGYLISVCVLDVCLKYRNYKAFLMTAIYHKDRTFSSIYFVFLYFVLSTIWYSSMFSSCTPRLLYIWHAHEHILNVSIEWTVYANRLVNTRSTRTKQYG